jgi:hypothetical protein
MKIKHDILTDKIHLLTFKNQLELTSTFLRFQEHYESPEFKGKIFTLKEYKNWYTKTSPQGILTGKFTYYSDWTGFNIPSSTLKPFYDGKFDPLSPAEKEFLNIFKNEVGPFYIIGVHMDSKNLGPLLKHEIAHGLFATVLDYKKEVQMILTKYDTSAIRLEISSKSGYHEDVLEDEIHAYCLSSGSKLKSQIPGKMSEELESLYNKYFVVS